MKKILQKYIERLFKAKIIPDWRLGKYSLALHLKEVFDFLDIDCVLDVGANTGQFALFLRQQVGFKGTIISFEPDRRIYKILEKHSSRDPNWHCMMTALGSEEKTVQFNIMADSQFNSVQQPDTATHFQEQNVIIDSYDVKIQTLDGLWQQLQAEHGFSSAYLKLDTQGFDLEVLKGSDNILSNFKALQSEMSVIPIYKNMPSYQDVIKFLESKNFSFTGMYAINLDRDMRLIEFDGILINNLFTSSPINKNM